MNGQCLHPGRYPCRQLMRLLCLCLIVFLGQGNMVIAQDALPPVQEIRVIYPSEWDAPNPVGLAYSQVTNQLFLLDDKYSRRPGAPSATVVTITPYEDLVNVATIASNVDDAINMLLDDKGKRFLLLDTAQARLDEIAVNADGQPDPGKRSSHNAARYAIRRPQGMTIDALGKYMYILDSGHPQVVRVTLDSAGGLGEAEFIKVDISELRNANLRGIALNPANGHLYLLGQAQRILFELTVEGAVIGKYDLSVLALDNPSGLVFAPSSDRTDDPATVHLFIADSGPKNKKRYGKIVEASLTAQHELVRAASASVVSTFLVQRLDAAAFTPPSPDPADIAWLPNQNRLLISDSEVDEMPNLFTGANLFVVTPPNLLTGTGSTLAYSDEPAGLGLNTLNGHLFVADDNVKAIFEVAPGVDGLIGTADDTVTSFDTDTFNSFDPEGVTFAAPLGDLFVVDGLNNEVYRIKPGVNGIFDGPPANGNSGDDVVSSFDTQALGILDPEGIFYDVASGNLIITGKITTEMYEVTTAGVLLRIFDISSAGARTPAGVTKAPGSINPADSNFYIVDRGVDNNIDPTENDGKVYEMTLNMPPADIYVSTRANGSAGGISFRNEDIVAYDIQSGEWTLYFDGSDVGVTTDINAFELLNDGSLIMSFDVPTDVSGLGVVENTDLVRFVPSSLGPLTAGSFEWYLDGSDVGLDTANENIDGVTVLSDGTVVVSTLESFAVPGVTGQDEDLIAFSPTQLGANSSGVWRMYFDGSDVGLANSSQEDVQAAWIDPATQNIYLSTRGAFSVPGLNGDGNDIFICTPAQTGDTTVCTYSLFWDGAANGFGTNEIDALFISNSAIQSSAVTQAEQAEQQPDSSVNDNADENAQDQRIFLPFVTR